jgi:trigger factor
MTTAVKTKTTELGDSRVRVEVEVPSEALESELRSAAAELGRELRIPGFRKGKVPPEVVLRQVGREAVMDEAVRRGLPSWYEQAVTDAGINAVGDPKLDLTDLPERGLPLSFTIEVGVVPTTRSSRSAGARPPPTRRRSRRSWSACASRWPRSRRSSAPPAPATSW